MSEPIPPRWIFQGRAIATAERETMFDRICFWASRDLRGRAVFGRRDLRGLGALPWGSPPPVEIRDGEKVKVRWQEPAN